MVKRTRKPLIILLVDDRGAYPALVTRGPGER